MHIHVVGPVLPIRSDLKRPPAVEMTSQIRTIYDVLDERLGSQHTLRMPFRDPKVDRLPPRAFTRHIRDEIRAADRVVAVYDADPGTVAETTMAALEGKPVFLIAVTQHVSRLVSGLPGVVLVDDIEGLVGQVVGHKGY